jgi:poly-D-alanine transfer protein DltD
MCFIKDVDEPHFLMEALNDEDSQHWTKTMDSKFQSLQNNKIWICIPFPPNRKLVNYKWIFKVKYNVDGFVARHKTCLVAKGFTQVEDINFDQTFFFVA